MRPLSRGLSHPLITARHLALSIIIHLRQSSLGQVRDNWGSTSIQEEQQQLALDYGWRPDQIIIIGADLGKSGSTTVGRTGWEEMLRLIATGTVGAVMAPCRRCLNSVFGGPAKVSGSTPSAYHNLLLAQAAHTSPVARASCAKNLREIKWRRVESNHGPRDYETLALAN